MTARSLKSRLSTAGAATPSTTEETTGSRRAPHATVFVLGVFAVAGAAVAQFQPQPAAVVDQRKIPAAAFGAKQIEDLDVVEVGNGMAEALYVADGRLRSCVIDLETLQVRPTKHWLPAGATRPVESVSLSDDGTRLAVHDKHGARMAVRGGKQRPFSSLRPFPGLPREAGYPSYSRGDGSSWVSYAHRGRVRLRIEGRTAPSQLVNLSARPTRTVVRGDDSKKIYYAYQYGECHCYVFCPDFKEPVPFDPSAQVPFAITTLAFAGTTVLAPFQDHVLVSRIVAGRSVFAPIGGGQVEIRIDAPPGRTSVLGFLWGPRLAQPVQIPGVAGLILLKPIIVLGQPSPANGQLVFPVTLPPWTGGPMAIDLQAFALAGGRAHAANSFALRWHK